MANKFASSLSGPEGLLLAAALIVFFIVRQFRTRAVLSLFNVAAPAVLLYFGLQGVADLDATGWLLLGLSLSLAIGLGAARGITFDVWTDQNGQAMMRGTRLTVVLWIGTIALKVVLTFAEIKFGFGAAAASTAASYLAGAATIGAQLLVVYLRAQDQRLASYQVS